MSPSQAVLIENVRFRWKPDLPWCLEIPRLSLALGESLFLHGPSGSGKSTLLNLIGGVVIADQGGVHVLGCDFRHTRATARDRIRADHIGFLFQQFNLVPYLTVVENVLLPCRFSKRRAERCLLQSASPLAEARRLLARLDIAPNLLQRRVTELSIGQQQRVAAARSIIGAPEIIVADEPTSALDAGRQMAFLELLLEQCAQSSSSLLFVSHDRRLESAFSRTLALDEINQAHAKERDA
jgi:putative ABC transport system ATP-binding protein